MEIYKITTKTKCDLNGCKSLADYSLKVNKMFFSNMFFCSKCLNLLYESIGKIVVPKPIKTPFKTKKIKE